MPDVTFTTQNVSKLNENPWKHPQSSTSKFLYIKKMKKIHPHRNGRYDLDILTTPLLNGTTEGKPLPINLQWS